MKQLFRTLSLLLLLWIPTMATTKQLSDEIEHWQTEEGADVYFIHAPQLPMVDLLFGLDAGAFRAAEKAGLAQLTASLMTKGAGDYDEEQFHEALEDLGINISAQVSLNQTLFNLRSLTDEETLSKALDLLALTLSEPHFDAAIFERERAQSIDAQKALLDNINAVASELYYETLYPESLLSFTSKELQDSLKSLSLDELKQFRANFYNATDANFVIVGALERSDAEAIAARFSKLLGAGESLPKIEEERPQLKAEYITHYFKSPQSRILMGHPSIDYFDEDYLPLILGNHILGGSGLTSQLMMKIREEMGLTYGISSSFSPSFIAGPFTIALSTQNERVDEAIEATQALLRNFIEHGPDEGALQLAKNNLIGGMVLSLDSNAKKASAVMHLALYDLPLDHYDHYPKRIEKITKEEIQNAFARHIHPEKMSTIIVGGAIDKGDSPSIEEKIEEDDE